MGLAFRKEKKKYSPFFLAFCLLGAETDCKHEDEIDEHILSRQLETWNWDSLVHLLLLLLLLLRGPQWRYITTLYCVRACVCLSVCIQTRKQRQDTALHCTACAKEKQQEEPKKQMFWPFSFFQALRVKRNRFAPPHKTPSNNAYTLTNGFFSSNKFFLLRRNKRVKNIIRHRRVPCLGSLTHNSAFY